MNQEIPNNVHTPVMLAEILEYLAIVPGHNYIDGTADGGGHVLAIAADCKPGKVMAIEWDQELFEDLKHRVKVLGIENLIPVHGSYVHMADYLRESNFTGVNGVVLDLGISSYHLSHAGRGFSFQADEPLDMRFDNGSDLMTAAEIVNTYSEEQLAQIIYDYGEERFSHQIAKAIVMARRGERIITTGQLVAIIRTAVPRSYQHSKIHYATRTFQALRIAVNQELENIQKGLEAAASILLQGGRLCVVSFHSLEDRIVKNFFKNNKDFKIITKKPLRASLIEIRANPRSRSAKLRVAERI